MSKSTLVRYERQDNLVKLRLVGMTNHELRSVLLGLWARLDRKDQADFIRELIFCFETGKPMSPVSRAVASGERDGRVIDVDKMRAEEFREEGSGS